MALDNPILFVLSGGPGSGKTTVLRELSKMGVQHAPEVARQIIQEQQRQGGAALPWKDREAYAGLMLQRSIDPLSRILLSNRRCCRIAGSLTVCVTRA